MKIQKFFDQLDLVIALIGSILSLILFFFDLIPVNYFYPIIFAILGTIVLSQLRDNASRDSHFKKLEDKIGITFDSRTVDQREFYILLDNAVSNAKSTVDLTYIERFAPEVTAMPEKTQYFQTIKNVVRRKKHIVFRLIYAIPPEPSDRIRKIEWIRSRLLAYQNCGNMNIRVVDYASVRSPVPLLSLQIVDSTEMLLIDMRKGSHSLSARVDDFWSNMPEAIKHFNRYYDLLWINATPLKEGNLIMWEILQELEILPPNDGV